MNTQRLRTRAFVTIVGLLIGCNGGNLTPAAGGQTGAAGTAGPGGGAGEAGVGGGAGDGTALGGAGGAAGSFAAGGTAGVVGGGGTATGGHAGNGAGGAGGASSSAEAKKIGSITVVQSAPVNAASISSLVHAFFSSTVPYATSNCSKMTSGACELSECSVSATTPSPPPPTYYSAGTVSISGLLSPVTIDWGRSADVNRYYAYYTEPLWTAPTPATLSVTGSADVPAFMIGLTFPSPISITAPIPTLGNGSTRYTISKAGALNVAWTGGVNGDVLVKLYSNTSPPASVSIDCTVAAAGGAVTVPATFMAKLGAFGSFTAMGTSHVDKMVGDWSMHFEAIPPLVDGSATFSN